MSIPLTRLSTPSTRRLQSILLLLILWDILAVLAELSFGGPLFKIDGDEIGGILAARGSFGGPALVLIWLYMYAFVRGPIRHRSILWLGALEQAAVVMFGIYHVARGHIAIEGLAAPGLVSLLLAVIILVNLPRDQATAP
jgi:hypothetical protein